MARLHSAFLILITILILADFARAFGGFNQRRQRRQRPQAPAEEEEIDLYEILRLDEEASLKEIKKAYRKLSKEYHPDRNLDNKEDTTHKFQEVSMAYEILTDEEKKFLYDMGGMAMLKQGVQENDPMQDMFGGFFGGGRGGTKRGPDAKMQLRVTLEELYSGAEKSAKMKRRVVCRGCGTKKGKKKARCKECGRCPNEVKMVQRQVGGGFIVQQQEEVPSKEKCKDEEKVLELTVERGMESGTEIRFKYMSEQRPQQIPGDVILVLQQQKHKRFERKGDHLHFNMKISLKQALIGFEATIDHLDGHKVEIVRDGITRPFETVVYEGEGMPLHEVPSQFGDMHVTFEVLFPKTLTEEQMEKVKQIL